MTWQEKEDYLPGFTVDYYYADRLTDDGIAWHKVFVYKARESNIIAIYLVFYSDDEYSS